MGAVTFGDGTTGVAGPVTTTNSLHGTTADETRSAAAAVTALTNGNYVVASLYWSDGATDRCGGGHVR